MPKSKRAIANASVDRDEVPDLTSRAWAAAFDAAPVVRGRPKSGNPKVSTTIRLDADILEHFRTQGPGWQTRINDALRARVKRQTRGA